MSDALANRLITRLESEAKKYPADALSKPVKRDEFEYGSHHGYMKALSHFKQWIDEELEAEENDENE